MTEDVSGEPAPSASQAGLTFAVADLHGRFDLLGDALEAIAAYPAGAFTRTAVFLGDYVDRGPHGAEVLERLIAGPPEGWRWICLKGNHEAMMALALRNPDRLDWWVGNGGDATVASYCERRDAIAAHLAWIDTLPTLHRDAHRVYVHAGVDPAIPLGSQADRTLLWKRYGRDDAGGHRAERNADGGEIHVVHGHDPDEAGPLLLAGRTALDTYAWATGRLVVGVFDDARAGGPVDLIEVRRRPA